MTQEERRIYLIRELQREMPQYENLAIPDTEDQQWRLLRSLFNVRPPYPASKDFLKVQDEYLSEMIRQRGITVACGLPRVKNDPKITLWQGDITTLRCDAIVNAANRRPIGVLATLPFLHRQHCSLTFRRRARIKCNEIMQAQGHEEETGTAKITPAYNLPCKYVLHTVGPIISGPLRKSDCDLLASCYQSCLELAAENEVQSIAFCCISTGVFHFPQERAAEIAIKTVKSFLETDSSIQQVIFNVFTDKDLAIYQKNCLNN